MECQGGLHRRRHNVVLTVLNRGQAVVLRRYLRQKDPNSFMIITNSSEIVGKGFLRG